MSDTFDPEGDAIEALISGQEDDNPHFRRRPRVIQRIGHAAPMFGLGSSVSWPLTNAGKAWTRADDEQLKRVVAHGLQIESIAKGFARTTGAIEARMAALGIGEFNSSQLPAAPTKEKIVNMTHLITLLQKGYTTVQVTFVKNDQEYIKSYTYKVDEATAKTLAPGDYVVVPVYSESELKVAMVKKVDAEPEIDTAAPYALKWVVQKVDLERFDDQNRREAEAVELLKKGQRRRAQEEALATLLQGTSREELMTLLNGAQG